MLAPVEPSRSMSWADGSIRHGARIWCRGRLLEALVKPGSDVVRRQLRPLALLTRDDDTGCRDAGDTGETKNLPDVHDRSPFGE